jgi:DNA-binding NarL/FixJ family response regulator
MGDLEGAEDALSELERSGLVTRRQEVVELGHPLVRSAVYWHSEPRDRRAAHLALARQMELRGLADRRAWHLAAAATGPDEELAAQLERLAARASERSAHSAASTGYERAADLSPTGSERSRRLVAAAETAWVAGQSRRARSLALEAEEVTDVPVLRGRLLHVRSRADSRNGDVESAYRTLCDGAAIVESSCPELALEMLADAVEAAMYAGDARRAEEAASRAAPLEPGDAPRERFMHEWLAASSAAMRGLAEESARHVRSCLDLTGDLNDPRLLTWAGIAAVNLGDISLVRSLFGQAVDRARSTAAVGSLAYALEKWAFTEALAGNYASARAAAEEGLQLALETEQLGSVCHLRATLALVAGTCGDEEACHRLGDEVLEVALPRRLGLPIANVRWAFGRLDLGRGSYGSAVDHLLSMHTTEPGRSYPALALWATPDLVEAAARANRTEEVSDAFARLTAWASASGHPTAAAGVARSRALMDETEPLVALEEAITALHTARSEYEAARTELVLGELLRRGRRRSEARQYLRSAFGTFERLGAAPWAERAAAELRATGEVVQQHELDGLRQLTTQELEIVRRVCQGASNRDIAAQLFLSPRTVEYHLYKAYPKLGVSTRAQLASRYGDDPALSPLG